MPLRYGSRAMGAIFGFRREFDDPADQLRVCAHHEAAHALRGHYFGVRVQEIVLDANRITRCYTRYAMAPESAEQLAQISIIGPMADLRYLVGAGYICWPPVAPDEGETTPELRYVIRNDCEWLVKDNDDPADKGATVVDYYGLDARKFPHHVILHNHNDFTGVFDALIRRHVERYRRIPTIETLIRHYRQQEQIARSWLDENWDRVCELAQLILNSPLKNAASKKQVKRYGFIWVTNTSPSTHRVSRKQFEKWVGS